LAMVAAATVAGVAMVGVSMLMASTARG